MDEFITHFLLCNIVISIIIGIFLVSKWIFKNTLTSRMQYNLWYFLLVLLLTPFFPVQSKQFPDLFSWLNHVIISPAFQTDQNKTVVSPATLSNSSDWMNEFTISVNSQHSDNYQKHFVMCMDCRYVCSARVGTKVLTAIAFFKKIRTSSSKYHYMQTI